MLPVHQDRRDHPGMRGEHSLFHLVLSGLLGSSPHARGALAGATDVDRTVGIIPACAGSTFRHFMGKVQDRDHPRMRGEHTL